MHNLRNYSPSPDCTCRVFQNLHDCNGVLQLLIRWKLALINAKMSYQRSR